MRTLTDLPPLPAAMANDPILVKAKEGLERAYGDRLAGAIFYGSRARGDARPDSDYDILVLLRDFDRERDWKPLHALGDELFQMEPHEIEVNFFPKREDALENERTIFMHNVREDGFRL